MNTFQLGKIDKDIESTDQSDNTVTINLCNTFSISPRYSNCYWCFGWDRLFLLTFYALI